MVVEVKAVVLDRAEARDTQSKKWSNIGLSIFRCPKDRCSAGLQDLRCRLEQRQVRGRCRHADTYRVSRAQVALNGGEMFGSFVFVRGGVSASAGVAELFIHPGNHANGAPGMQPELLDELGRLHGHNNSSAIIDGPGAKVP